MNGASSTGSGDSNTTCEAVQAFELDATPLHNVNSNVASTPNMSRLPWHGCPFVDAFRTGLRDPSLSGKVPIADIRGQFVVSPIEPESGLAIRI